MTRLPRHPPSLARLAARFTPGTPAFPGTVAMAAVILVLGLAHIRTISGAAVHYQKDLWSIEFPSRLATHRTPTGWRGGDWLPQIYCGFPFGRDWYPFNAILGLPLPAPLLYSLLTFSQYVLAAAGMFALCRWLGRSRLAAGGAALLYSLSGFLVAHLIHLSVLSAGAWIPWVLLGGARFVESRRLRWGLLASLGIAMQCLAPFPQVALFTALTLLPFTWVCAQREGAAGEPPRPRLPSGAVWRLGFVVFTGGLFAAIHLAPLLALARQSQRVQATSFEFATSYSLAPKHLVTLLSPFILGKPFDPPPGPQAGHDPPSPTAPSGVAGGFLDTWHRRITGTSWFDSYGQWNHWELTVYVGLLPLLVASLWATRGPDARRARGLWAIALASLFLAFGHHNPLYHLLWRIPGWSAFRCPTRWVAVWSAMIPLLFATAIDHLRGGAPGPRVLGRFARWLVPARLWDRVPFSAGAVAATLIVLATVEVFAFSWAYNPVAPPELFTEAPPVVRLLGASPPRGRLVSVAVGTPAPEELTAPGVPPAAALQGRLLGPKSLSLAPNFNLLWGVSLVDGYHPLALSTLAGLRQNLDVRVPHEAALLGIEYLVSDKPAPIGPRGWEPTGRTTGLTVYRNPRFAGLAWLSHRVRPSDRLYEDLTVAGMKNGFPTAFAYTDEDLPRLQRKRRLARPDEVRIGTWDDREIVVDCDSDERGVLVLCTTFYPGWRATLDGQPAKSFPCNKAFTGIEVPSGRHRVRLTYHPPGLAAGFVMAAAGALFWLALALAGSLGRPAAERPIVDTPSGLKV